MDKHQKVSTILRRWKFVINGDTKFSCSESEFAEISESIDDMFSGTGSVVVSTKHIKPWSSVVIDFYRNEPRSIAFIVESDLADINKRVPKCLFHFEWGIGKCKNGVYEITSGGYSITNFDPELEDEEQVILFENNLVSGLNSELECIISSDVKLNIISRP
jgi:hypothetical protein